MIIILVKFLWSWIDDAHDTELNSFLLVVDMINNFPFDFLFSFFTWFTDAQHKEDAGDEIHDEVQAPLLSDLL